MLRDLIAWVLNNYLGKYVGNLNTAQLTVALLSGEVELENLPLRRDALRNLGLPLQALSGSVGKIKLQVPVRQFRTAPWCIFIEKVYIVIGPINLDEWDADAEEQADLDYKVARLDRLEAKWRAAREASIEGGYYASSYSGWMSYGTSLVTNIVENLQLKINDVHIRYEDSITVPNHRFACGVTIESLSAQSCDANWLPGFTTSQNTASFKLVELQSMNFYWDNLNNHETFGEIPSSDLAAAMQKNKTAWIHQNIISPVSAQAKLKRDRSELPLRTRSRPRLVCDLLLNEVSLSIADWQYNQMVECIRGLDDIAKYRRFRLIRPHHPISEGPKAWWLYAARCHGLLKAHKHYGQGFIKDNLKYLEIYKKIIKNPNETLSTDDKEHKDKVEKERDYGDLKILREVCMTEIPTPEGKTDSTNQGRSLLLQWFPQWLGWYNNNGNQDVVQSPTSSIPESPNTLLVSPSKDQLEDELLNALSSSNVESNSLLKRDAVFGKFDFTLKKGTLDICSGAPCSENTLMMQLQFENLLLSVESRPRSASHFVGLSLGAVLLKDRITPNTEFPDLIRPQIKDDATTRQRTQKRSASSIFSTPNTSTNSSTNINEPLFLLQYERKPLSHNSDYRLVVKSQSLDIVYNTGALRWIIDFVSKPHQVVGARKKLEAMKNRTKKELMKNWENMLEGDLTQRKTWALEIDISAPQIIFVENFINRNGSIVVIDFGRLQLTNGTATSQNQQLQQQQIKEKKLNDNNGSNSMDILHRDSEDEEAFMTPCSTPPGSHASTTDSPTLCSALGEIPEMINQIENTLTLNEGELHNKIYDKYSIDFTDLQVLVCKGKDGWSFASAKGTSTLHVLDRFNISLQVERRVIYTMDPQYPSLKLSGSLPKLVVHVNEPKIAAITTMLNIISTNETHSLPYRSPTENINSISEDFSDDTLSIEDEQQKDASKLIMIQFAIDQMVLEVQSHGRGIAELQVSGVKAGFSKRQSETNITLSVHGLLLVDAIQSFGPDFELLIASHRHVGIDSVSGSLKQSEPCSPNSPASPDPLQDPRRPTSPHTITKALHSLQRANSSVWSAAGDLDALITVEILFLMPENETEQLQIANIQFNNLDIIANQETIVELIGFAKRVFPKQQQQNSSTVPSNGSSSEMQANVNDDKSQDNINNQPQEPPKDTPVAPIRTEITFDFHRLNVLVLRALMRDNYMVGRKVGTFTMSEARIHATLGDTITVEGSLGGLQILDLTPEGVNHQRILSVGKDPLTEPPVITKDLLSSLTEEIYAMGQSSKNDEGMREERQALSFTISRNLNACVSIKIRMASVWYTYCARFMQELSWCASEFKHYLKNLAKSIREKATDMALGLVQPRADLIGATPRSTYAASSTFASIHDPYLGTPKVKIKLSSSTKVEIRLDVVLDTPVLVVPRSSCSPQVFVAHLGKISVSNCPHNKLYRLSRKCDTNPVPIIPKNDSAIFTISEESYDDQETFSNRNGIADENEDDDDVDFGQNPFLIEDIFDNEKRLFFNEENIQHDDGDEVKVECKDEQNNGNNLDTYLIDVRNMNLFSLDTSNRKGFRLSALPRAEEFYSCENDAVAILHDTAIRLEITRIIETPLEMLTENIVDSKDILQITGSVVKPLHLSLSRQQYEQLLETVDNIFKVPTDLIRPPSEAPINTVLKMTEDDVEIETNIKRRLFNQPSLADRRTQLEPKVSFELPTFIIELKNDLNDPLIKISFRDFNVNYEKNNQYETSVQVSLRSLLMEDLLRPPDCKHRIMVISSSPDTKQSMRPSSAFSSRSCPNLVGLMAASEGPSGSLPEHLESRAGFCGMMMMQNRDITKQELCPETPPPSPQTSRQRQDNLVLYSSLIVDPTCPTFETQYNSLRQSSSIDFNSLDLVISVQSWFVLLNFFGLLSDDDSDTINTKEITTEITEIEPKQGNSELEISVRSLTLVLIKPDYEIAKANVSNAHFIVSKHGVAKTVEGRLGSVSLYDLTTHGSIYRERFLTSGNEALNFNYYRPAARTNKRSLNRDAKLKIQMSSVRYVHTKRFVMEIQAFFKEFLQLQTPVMRKIKPSESRHNLQQRPTQLELEINAGSPIILLPMSSKSDKIIVADLGEFYLKNNFKWATDQNVISIQRDPLGSNEVLDIMSVELFNTDLFAGLRYTKMDNSSGEIQELCLDMGSYSVVKKGPSLLRDKCHLKLQVERNMDTWRSHNCPDFSVQGTLSRLEAVLDLEQYKLVRGFLSYNMGEEIDDLYVESSINFNDSRLNLSTEPERHEQQVWTNLSITLDLQDVSVRLQLPATNVCNFPILGTSQNFNLINFDNFYAGGNNNNTALACINFIKSSLKIDSFSDGTQDIDLVSQEILVTDSRCDSSTSNSPRNVFTNILQPIHFQPDTDSVQAEVHSRKRKDCSKFTILLNNMRLMAIVDWLESVRDFLSQSEEPPKEPQILKKSATGIFNESPLPAAIENPIELILNITDSELVIVEKTDQWDTNAIILKSTTIVSFRPAEINKVMSINLNHLEVFSCILGSEEDTALSIIDPVTINLDVRRGVLDIQLQKRLCIRLSYHDVKMFSQMLQSLPNQTRNARSNKELQRTGQQDNQNGDRIDNSAVQKLLSLGFTTSDCQTALCICNNQLDEAALWLTQNAEPLKNLNIPSRGPLDIHAIELSAACISICVIDDCKDADVPLLELSLSQLDLRQELESGGDFGASSDIIARPISPIGGFRAGYLKGVFASDYYNRGLSGWEPLVEPWKCEAKWSYSLGQTGTQKNRLHLQITSEDLLNLNITSTIIELYQLVRDNWTQDYYGGNSNNVKSVSSPVGYRRRTPFVPFALKNETGVKLWFTTLVSSPGGVPRIEVLTKAETRWRPVEPGAIATFSFGPPNKLRHHDSHKLNLHQVGVRVEGWTEVGPVSVDRVGVYFRHARYEMALNEFASMPRTRIVFSVSLEGSAQKLVTVRSSLRLVNKLDNPVLVKMEHLYGHMSVRNWPDTMATIVASQQIYSIPLSHVHSFLHLKPLSAVINYDECSTVTTVTTVTCQTQQFKFNGNDYWTKYESCDSKQIGSNNNIYQFSEKAIHWKDAIDATDVHQELRMCKSNREKIYRMVVAIKKEGYPSKEIGQLPGHSIVLCPPLRLYNLLPCDLLYRLPSGTHGRISPLKTANIHEIDLEDQINLTVTLDGYPGSGHITVPAGNIGTIETKLKLTDVNNRLLLLRASIQMVKGSGMQISISAPYWLVNRTGLPLVFRQEGVPYESSGQYMEHEQARLVSPLMFSFSDPDASPSLIFRLGKRYGMNPPWCQPFNLHKDTLHRQLKSANSNETFVIGIEVRRGRGRYSKTSVVTFSPRFQLYNRSPYKLQFAQKYYATTLSDPLAKATFIEAVPDCHLPFHWPRLDKDQELCVRLPQDPDCLWSGGIPIYESQSLYINIRNLNGDMHFLRLEIVLQGATYFLLFGEAQALPPPIRIDNYSEVPMKFYQPGCKHQWRTMVRPQSSIAYALDEPMGSQSLQIEAPGGISYNYSLRDIGMPHNLTYENFIYIAFSGTFKRTSPGQSKDIWEFDVEGQQLVLGVIENRVVLMRKQPGDRSQLWRMNQDKQLEHEGSSPPTEPGKKLSSAPRFVLDLEKPPQPMQYISLVVRPANKQRKFTQTWRFTEEGRLMCEHSNMCVQARDGFFGLRPGSEAVLGMIVSDTHVITESLVPLEQAIERQKLRPGSGCLSIVVSMDGPIKTVRIRDINSRHNSLTLAIDPSWKHVSHVLSHFSDSASNNNSELNKSIGEFHINLKLTKGLGISIVSKRPCEELAYVSLENITLEAVATPSVRSLDLSVADMQIDNQLFETPCPVMLFTMKLSPMDSPMRQRLSALQLTVKMLPSPNTNAVIFEHLILSLRPMVVYLEERLMLRLADFMGLGNSQPDAAALSDESDFEVQRVATKVMAANAKRYYFGDLQIVPSQNRLSVITASKLSPQMSEMKKSLGLTLIKFEDAVIEFEKFTDKHHFETSEVYLRAIKSHYKQELKWQAASILGSVDFLGNPLGFANDLSEGVSGLIFEGSVKSLVKNVTHGISNSTAKLTETISDGLGRVVLDEQDTETRQRILEVPTGANSTGDHLVAGLKGFGFGLLGGVTSIVKHTYAGAQNDGIQGFISGLGKGLVGTVTKPVIGVLDLASETANAVRETSKSSNRTLPERKRYPRCVTGAPGGLLPPYSFTQGKGQHILFLINKRDFGEQLMAYEPCLFDGRDSKLRLIVSTENVWVFSRTEEATTIIFSYHLSDLVSCHPVSVNGENGHKSKKVQYYIELCLTIIPKSTSTSSQEVVKRPRVRCQSEEIAQKASRHINYAKGIYDEREQTLNSDTVIDI